ncbi:MAG: hypothetical protein ACMXYD_01865 [Candidatus Woesearchaeota archaeon]
MNETIVTHCLAIWHTHTGSMHQSDKDFFDAHVQTTAQESCDEFVAAQELITARLHEFGHEYDEAIRLAQELVRTYAQRFGVRTEQLQVA